MNDLNYTSELVSLLREGEALIIVPPFVSVDRPCLAAHVLQACAGKAGFRVSVLYANILLASAIGVENYAVFCNEAMEIALVGERFFARSAHSLGPLGSQVDRMFDPSMIPGEARARQIGNLGVITIWDRCLDLSDLKQMEKIAIPWADEVAAAVIRLPFQVVGCTTSFGQTNASIALLKRIKRRCPQTITIIGGANCEGEMAEGVASLDPTSDCIDYIFAGESEATFPAFLQSSFAGRLLPDRIVCGEPCQDLDALPTPDFTEYFEQHDHYLSDTETLSGNTWLFYETSRGCWWGQKHQCTFCGQNGERIGFRQKSPERVISDLRTFVEAYPTQKVYMADNIMPYTYFRTLIPKLADEALPLEILYALKVHLSLANVLALERAGVLSVQPGIEALSSALLKRMDKGVLARQNLMFLRYARSVGLNLHWNLLWGFPNDELHAYEQTLALLPLMYHLQPPIGMYHLFVDRFSLYFNRPEAYGVSNVRPLGAYAAAFPPHADVEKIAYYFVADYECAAYRNRDLIQKIMQEVTAWQKSWASGFGSIAILQVTHSGNTYLLIDTRGLPGTQPIQVLDRAQASVVLTARPYTQAEEIAWALERKLGVVVDSWYVPLATAKPELLQEFEDEFSKKGAFRVGNGQ